MFLLGLTISLQIFPNIYKCKESCLKLSDTVCTTDDGLHYGNKSKIEKVLFCTNTCLIYVNEIKLHKDKFYQIVDLNLV